MSYYFTFDVDGALNGRYCTAINGDDIPSDAVGVSEELFSQSINESDGIWKRDPKTGNIEKKPLPDDVHLNPAPTPEQLADTARAERDRLIESVRWRIERHSDELALNNEPTEPLEPLLQYTQALRDVPQRTGFPESVEWPQCP